MTVHTAISQKERKTVGVIGIPLQPTSRAGITASCLPRQGTRIFVGSSLVATVSASGSLAKSIELTVSGSPWFDGVHLLGTEGPQLGLATAAMDVPRVWFE